MNDWIAEPGAWARRSPSVRDWAVESMDISRSFGRLLFGVFGSERNGRKR